MPPTSCGGLAPIETARRCPRPPPRRDNADGHLRTADIDGAQTMTMPVTRVLRRKQRAGPGVVSDIPGTRAAPLPAATRATDSSLTVTDIEGAWSRPLHLSRRAAAKAVAEITQTHVPPHVIWRSRRDQQQQEQQQQPAALGGDRPPSGKGTPVNAVEGTPRSKPPSAPESIRSSPRAPMAPAPPAKQRRSAPPPLPDCPYWRRPPPGCPGRFASSGPPTTLITHQLRGDCPAFDETTASKAFYQSPDRRRTDWRSEQMRCVLAHTVDPHYPPQQTPRRSPRPDPASVGLCFSGVVPG
eukprot:TRINITY_DN4687_c0_g1_i1.p1 TRINITY_DN4687_c0_g1~~TRINITY_DN4687_c0_g1_i1.p1  ORF type:complete len:298 (+),score=48.74 TRINITY_DN4687_c0_g1_i1:57-950(+)